MCRISTIARLVGQIKRCQACSLKPNVHWHLASYDLGSEPPSREIAQERFKRGKITIFEVTQKEDTLTTARNNELGARLDFWLSMVELDRILGTTLDTWSTFIQPDQWLR